MAIAFTHYFKETLPSVKSTSQGNMEKLSGSAKDKTVDQHQMENP
jgi:hypothetical protein